MIKSRRRAREAALKALYQIEVGQVLVRDVLFELRESNELNDDLFRYAEGLVRHVAAHGTEIDDLITAHLHDWELHRIALVDKNVMRVATAELLFEPTIPPAVTLNEAIEIVRKYSTIESGKFVNGVLGSLLNDTPKADWNPENGEQSEAPEPEEPVEEEQLTPEAAESMLKAGAWKVRSD
ncbi:MAG: transcription antitermination factor NusB [Fimbriimonadaceae bacterium]